VQQVGCRDAIDVGKAAIGIGVKIEAPDEVEQAAIDAVGNRDRQRRLVIHLDVTADEAAQQRAQALLRGLAPAKDLGFSWKFLKVRRPWCCCESQEYRSFMSASSSE